LSQPASLGFFHPAALLATWFGIGRLPAAPGTWGSLAALPFAWAIVALGGPWLLMLAAGVLFVAGCWAADRFARSLPGQQDPQSIVVDEVAAQWLVLTAVPLDPLLYALAFALFRIADIMKPWPASWADRQVPGGFGIMLDDALAAPYAMMTLWLVELWRSGVGS